MVTVSYLLVLLKGWDVMCRIVALRDAHSRLSTVHITRKCPHFCKGVPILTEFLFHVQLLLLLLETHQQEVQCKATTTLFKYQYNTIIFKGTSVGIKKRLELIHPEEERCV